MQDMEIDKQMEMFNGDNDDMDIEILIPFRGR